MRRLATIHETVRTPEVRLAHVRGERVNLMNEQVWLYKHALPIKRSDLEIMVLLRVTPGLTSKEIHQQSKLCPYAGVVARRLTILYTMGLVKFRCHNQRRKWFLDEAGFDAVEAMPT